MRLFIAEKPDLAKSIMAGMSGESKAMKGYHIKGNDIITYAFGHLLSLCEPDEYDIKYKKWSFTDLPFKIDSFKYKPKKDKSAKDQLKLICELINDNRVSEIVNCGDADEEGQILIDEIITYSKSKKPVLRLILQDLTVKGVKKALEEIKPNSDFKGVSECGFARSQADWLMGLNLTRAYTIKAGNAKGVISVGRVQTPILGLVVSRDLEHEGHKSSFYYTISADFRTHDNVVSMLLKTKEPINQEDLANQITTWCKDKEGTLEVSHENESTKCPLPFNLLDLQAQASNKFKFKPDYTLEVTQKLREEHKLISYNRSDCSYLPLNLHSEAPSVLKAISNTISEFSELVQKADPSIQSHAFNDSYITAHYGIIPTDTSVDESKLSKDEVKIYRLIARNYIAQFYPDKSFKKSVASIKLGDFEFNTTSTKILNKGWQELFKDEKEEEAKSSLENISSGNATCIDIKSERKKTKPKPYYTMATLLKDLASASKYINDESIKKLLKDKDKGKKGENGGIGTPATRSEHLKTLFIRNYIVEDGKNIKATDLGRELISKLPPILTKPDITALWWQHQQDIMFGLMNKDEFLNEVQSFISNRIVELEKAGFSLDSIKAKENTDYPCKCGKGFLQRRKSAKTGKFFWGCSDWKNGCKEMYPDNKGKPLLQQNKTISLEYICPKCKDGNLIKRESKNQEGTFWLGCSNWKGGCKFTCQYNEKDMVEKGVLPKSAS